MKVSSDVSVLTVTGPVVPLKVGTSVRMLLLAASVALSETGTDVAFSPTDVSP